MYEGIDQAKLGEEIENFVSFFDENKQLFSKNVLTEPLVPYDVHLLAKAYINSKYGFGHENLTLTHPTDIVCRTSDYVCPRTLMINADKAARDLDSDLIEDLKNALTNPPADFPKIKDIITVDGIRVIFEKGWGLVRASNTTPKLVTRFEADTKENAKIYEEVLINLFNKLQGK